MVIGKGARLRAPFMEYMLNVFSSFRNLQYLPNAQHIAGQPV